MQIATARGQIIGHDTKRRQWVERGDDGVWRRSESIKHALRLLKHEVLEDLKRAYREGHDIRPYAGQIRRVQSGRILATLRQTMGHV